MAMFCFGFSLFFFLPIHIYTFVIMIIIVGTYKTHKKNLYDIEANKPRLMDRNIYI